jgi:lipid II:glycine glycyltransferase (peptidoglycan interpeptide bridge formation enzyme)
MGLWSTLLADPGRDEDEIMASFRQQTRYEIKKSLRLGIEVSEEDTPEGWSTLARLDEEVALRAPVRRVGVKEVASISRHWRARGAGGTVLVARSDREPLAAALVILYGNKAYVPVLPSSRRGKLAASHLLVWEAMRWAKRHACVTYDPVGYNLMARPGDLLWGVNQFKRGFASMDQLTKSVAVHERVFAPVTVAAVAQVRRWQAARRRGAAGHSFV